VIRLPPADLAGPDEALKYLIDNGLTPVWIWPPQDGEQCTCGKKHSASGKHPIAKSWQKRATFDELADQLARFKFTPNIGIVLGEQPGGEYLIGMDVDDEPRLTAIVGDLGPLPDTVRGESGRGYRLLFELGNEVNRDELRNITGLCGEPGVDVKIKGGQVVVAPSLHLSGKKYTWTKFGEIARLPSAWALALLPKSYTVPPWVEGYTPTTMKEDKRAKKRAEKYLEKAVLADASLLASSREGTRNTVLHKSVVRCLSLCAGLQLPEHWEWVQREMHKAALAAGLRESEVTRTIASAERYVRESGQVRFPVGLKDPPRAKSTGPAAPGPKSPPDEHEPTGAPGEAPPSPPPPDSPPPGGGYEGDPLETIKLSMDRGSPAKTAGNVYMLLSLHPVWRGGPRLDTYSQTEIWPMPLPHPIANIHRVEREIVDADHAAIQAWLMSQPDSHRVRVGIDTVTHGLRLAASRSSCDLLRDFINTLPGWDGTERVGTWTTVYLGCPDTPYARATGKAWMVAAIERALVPGTVVDVIPVLEGGQKSGKNYALEVLFAGGPSWAPFIQIIAGQDLEKPETLRLACTRWVLHDDELRARDPKRVDALKSWASRTRETFRLPYSREITVAGRRAVLVTSTNLESYLHDETGNRRWWPWATGKIDVPALDRDRLQLFAEALHLVINCGAGWRDGMDAIYEETLKQSDSRRVRDPLVEKIATLFAQGRLADPVTTNTIGTTLGFPVDRIDRALETRVGSAMRELGYHSTRVSGPDGVRMRAYVKTT
jgi:hypothetical protein